MASQYHMRILLRLRFTLLSSAHLFEVGVCGQVAISESSLQSIQGIFNGHVLSLALQGLLTKGVSCYNGMVCIHLICTTKRCAYLFRLSVSMCTCRILGGILVDIFVAAPVAAPMTNNIHCFVWASVWLQDMQQAKTSSSTGLVCGTCPTRLYTSNWLLHATSFAHFCTSRCSRFLSVLPLLLWLMQEISCWAVARTVAMHACTTQT